MKELFLKTYFSRAGRMIQTGLRLVAWLGVVAMGLFFLFLDAIRIYIFKRF